MDISFRHAGIVAAFGILVLFYAAVGAMVFRPRVDEDYRRTYLTREFGVYPPSAFFKGRNGLDYVPGDLVDLSKPKARLHLNRFDWIWRGPPGPLLDGHVGRIYLHVTDDRRRPDLPHRLVLTMVCTLPSSMPDRLTVTVNGVPAASSACPGSPDPFTVAATLPAGAIGRERYDAIVVTRRSEGLGDRVETAIGARLASVSLVSFKVEPLIKP